MLRARTFLRLYACALAFVSAAWIAAGSALAQEPMKVQVDWSPHGMHAGLHLAVKKGWFRDAGLNVEVLDGKGSNATIQQVAAGQIDVGFAQLASMAAAVSNGLPVTSIMGFVRAGDNGLMFPIDSPAKTLADLKGARIAVPAAGGTSSFLDAFLKAGGVTEKDFKIIRVDSQAMVATYTAGGADAVLSTVAFFLPIVEKTRPSRGISFSDVGLNVPGYGLLVRRGDIEAKSASLAKFVAVQQKTWDYIFAGHEEEAIDAMMANRAEMRLDRTVLLGQLKAYMPLFFTANTKGKPIGWQSDADWKNGLEAMEKAGLVKPGWKTEQFYTNRFIPNS